MAESENQTQQLEEEENVNYKAPAKVSLDELKEKDKEDESLEKYKAQLLGAAKDKIEPPFPDNPANVIVKAMALVVEGRENVELDLTGDLTKLKSITMKEGTSYRIQIQFYVQRDIVAGLRYNHKVSRKGIPVDKNNVMVGSYGPKQEAQSYTTSAEEAPSGMIARGTYTIKSKFTDDDKNVYREWEWKLDIKKDWD
ncbi:hypothetical protein FSP39_022995 [Pinctada imbricata]|uniref:Rho GDP-dissociation inhibitor 3 n=1 Tax=Pinctada imbricata TaxID=66713 RepID=A0AA88XT37_PINIB|nr:hypothetical protein FSP39_022995 [Pinctada imbricata]